MVTKVESLLATSSLPTVRLSPLGTQLVRAGTPWLRPTHIVEWAIENKDVVFLIDPKGVFLGTALYAPQSRLPLRILSRERHSLDHNLLKERILRAQTRRQGFLQGSVWYKIGLPNAYRLVHAEADQLPGLVIDRYGEAAVVQTATRAMDARKHEIAQILAQDFGLLQVISRDDGGNRDLEKLPRTKEVLHGSSNTLVSFQDAGSWMEADLLHDGKTGAFLDQQENHAWCVTQSFVPKGRALDVFTYHGGFALALARAGFSVIAGDENPLAVARAQHNAQRNGLSVEFQVRNAFDWLRALETQQQRFSLVVVDPPALAKRGQSRNPQVSFDAARRAYKELNLRALRIVQPEGLLITCSCSGSISGAAFEDIVNEASHDAGRPVQIIERRRAGHDHPTLLGVPETDHLKCLILRILS